jgi:hypothetical protein
MTGQDYKRVLDEAVARLTDLVHKREEVELEIQKTIQFIYATVNMLPEAERDKFWAEAEAGANRSQARTEGLTAAIKDILSKSPKEWFTITMMRDRLVAAAFDFSCYASNPLASISAVLRRAKPDEIESKQVEGVRTYRWKAKRIPDRKKTSFYRALLRTPLRSSTPEAAESPAQYYFERSESDKEQEKLKEKAKEEFEDIVPETQDETKRVLRNKKN